ncbi:MAG: DNA replication and repair protein RecF [Ignavibacteria bacterium]|nr:DNA replication and repair protein RecF [Ignavibacteria bacterium]
MNLASVRVRNFRNHRDSVVEFGSGINFLIGGNGQGKTSILEAISYFGLTKSFFSASDLTTLRKGAGEFEIEGDLLTGSGTREHILIRFDREAGEKKIGVNRSLLERQNHLIGRFPVVVLSPESGRITAGAPAERRKFLDMVLAQRSRSYLEDLLEYRRVLRQRNRLLLEGKGGRGGVSTETLRPWSESLTRTGARIIDRRRQFVTEFLPAFVRVHGGIAQDHEEVTMEYRTTPTLPDEPGTQALTEMLSMALARTEREERRRGATLVGPHRDDLLLSINGMNAQDHASQGQHKTMILAMKIAEFEYLAGALDEVPVLLLDDLFSELDEARSDRIIRLVSTLGQSVITATTDPFFNGEGVQGDPPRTIIVEDGTCRIRE